LGLLLVLTAVLGGAVVLRRADETVAVLSAARDLPSGVPLTPADLRPVRVRLPAPQLARYARPGSGVLGGSLASGLPKDALVPLALIAPVPDAASLVEYPIPIEPAGVPGGLRPGDRVAVVVAGGDQGGPSAVLLRAVEVIRLLRGGDGFGGDDRIVAVEVRMPKDRLASVADAIAGGHVSLARLLPGDLGVGEERAAGTDAGTNDGPAAVGDAGGDAGEDAGPIEDSSGSGSP
jgi:hypothetical protein